MRGSKRTEKPLSYKSPLMELQAIPKPNQEEVILHFSHPHHPLVLMNLPYLFTCMGCKEFGAGKRMKCQICDFELHDFCAFAPASLINHPFHYNHQLVFYTKSGGFLSSRCQICSNSAKGYVFKCTICGFQMHPCCAMMNWEMNFPIHQHPMIISQQLNGDVGILCRICHRKKSGLMYCCGVSCGYYIHAICAKEMINGLYENGIKPPEKSKMMGTSTLKLASHFIFGIIGDLVEGIGEGIGESLIDSIARGRCASMRSKLLPSN
ncbi:hypothetical protein MA16_Dca007674 [Dendrobium catenatum]|uniref:DC1 domain-containing protein n=2 Tax=Dendrobium catenatum TaxID=906689 RepID=A0A2I0X111_9ASPA|nr:hypothetical protein MA16_Dca007674 [Dendrobium catenatum]